MYMTHYMELLSTTSNLLIFMALPVVLAETAAITELIILFSKSGSSVLKKLNKLSCIAGALVFTGIDLYLIKEVVLPLTYSSGWYGLVDMLAVFFFIAGGLVMIALGVFSLNIFALRYGQRAQRGIRIGLLSAFLVISHIAMIAGMADPRIDPDFKAQTEVSSAVSDSEGSALSSTDLYHMHHH